MTHEPVRRVLVVGAANTGRATGAALLAAGIGDFVLLDKKTEPDLPTALREQSRGGCDVTGSVFDDATATWSLHTATGECLRSQVVIAAHRPVYVPWIPELPGRHDFRGAAFHAAAWDRNFDPSGRHIAVIGTDAAAGHYLEGLTESAASVTVFAHAPRRVVAEIPSPTTRIKRWLRRPWTRGGPPPSPVALVSSAIESLTPSGIHTSDGVDYRADAIVYGTGYTIPASTPDDALVGTARLGIRHAWRDGMEPYLGVAVHGFPNYFFVTGPDVAAQIRYVVACLRLLERRDGTRIELRRSTQEVFNQRVHLKPGQPHRVTSTFDVTRDGHQDVETYDGAATLTVAGARHPVRVRLAGRLDPIDGRYHWQGTVFSSSHPLPDDAFKKTRSATLTVGERSATARIVEQTPWGTHSVAGVGAPPYELRGGV